jgi:hypothetical protein
VSLSLFFDPRGQPPHLVAGGACGVMVHGIGQEKLFLYDVEHRWEKIDPGGGQKHSF